jgi:hypothetical protein
MTSISPLLGQLGPKSLGHLGQRSPNSDRLKCRLKNDRFGMWWGHVRQNRGVSESVNEGLGARFCLPEGGPDTTDRPRHVSDISNEEAVGVAFVAGDSNRSPAC